MKDQPFLRSFLLTILLSTISFVIAMAQHNSSYVFRKDFVYKNNVFRIEVESEPQNYNFYISYSEDSSARDTFSLVSLSGLNVFQLSFENAIKKLQKSIMNKNEEGKATFNTIIEDILKSVKLDSSYVLTAELKEDVSDFVSDLSSIDGCDTLFHDKRIDTIKYISSSLNQFFLNQELSCISFNRKNEEVEKGEIHQLSSTMYEELKVAIRVNPSEASLAGRLRLKENVWAYALNNDNTYRILSLVEDIYSYDNDSIRDTPDFDSHLAKEISRINESDSDSIRSLIFKFELDSVQMEFENGTLNNVKAIGRIGDRVEIFQNLYPIPYSTKNSMSKQLQNYFLTSTIETEILKIRYPDLFYNNYELLLKTENYSPKDQVVMLYPKKTALIYKESNKEILSTRVYTDLVGLGEDEPNGIIQLEFSKVVNLYTGLRPYSRYKGNTYFTFFNFIKPIFTLSKIEDDDSELVVNKYPTLPESVKVVTYEDLLKYRRSSIGAELNLFGIGMPGIQSKFSFNFDLSYHLIAFSDEITTTDTTGNMTTITENSFTRLARDFGPTIEWTINPSDKYQFLFKYSPKWFRFYPSDDNEILPIKNLNEARNSEELNNISPTRMAVYHYVEFLASTNISDSGDLFFRSRFSFLNNMPQQQFFQIQLGYSFYFFSRNK